MATKNISTKIIRLTPTDKRQLEMMCGDRTNWSDGGYWIGGGKTPNCFGSSAK